MSESIKIQNCTLQLVKQDITDFEVEAFVFYAEPNLALGSGYGSAIARRGGPSIKAELDKIGSVSKTDAVITEGGSLKAKYIVHAVGPTFQEEQIQPLPLYFLSSHHQHIYPKTSLNQDWTARVNLLHLSD